MEGVHLRGEEAGIQHQPHLFHHRAVGGGVPPQQADVTAVLFDEPQHGLDGGALPGTVLPDKAHDAPHGQGEADPVQGKCFVFLAQVPQFNGVGHN